MSPGLAAAEDKLRADVAAGLISARVARREMAELAKDEAWERGGDIAQVFVPPAFNSIVAVSSAGRAYMLREQWEPGKVAGPGGVVHRWWDPLPPLSETTPWEPKP